MGIPWDDVVVIKKGKTAEEPSLITVNCPDRSGLGCDLCRIILEFGLIITKGDVSTDGRWCYIMLWVFPHASSLTTDWASLETRLLSVCPSCLIPFYISQQPSGGSSHPSLYVLKLFCTDQKGLLHAVTRVLCELELTIQKVKVMTNPDGRALDLFFITDGLDLLHTKNRRDDTCKRIESVLGDSCINCELQVAGPEYGCHQESSLSFTPAISQEILNTLLAKEPPSSSLKPEITVDNLLSPAHTLLQVHCVDQKGLLYDILRTIKDLNMRMTYGRFSPSVKGKRDMDLFIQSTDGYKIVDSETLTTLCSRLKSEMLHSLRVTITDRGPDTELLVANPVELSGKGRPRVFLDATFALKSLGICIFTAEIGRLSTEEREWEVYRFRLVDLPELPLASGRVREKIVDGVKRTLMDPLERESGLRIRKRDEILKGMFLVNKERELDSLWFSLSMLQTRNQIKEG
ncbi:hypothetical protein V2J09_008311 [Rumex salicifolius]